MHQQGLHISNVTIQTAPRVCCRTRTVQCAGTANFTSGKRTQVSMLQLVQQRRKLAQNCCTVSAQHIHRSRHPYWHPQTAFVQTGGQPGKGLGPKWALIRAQACMESAPGNHHHHHHLRVARLAVAMAKCRRRSPAKNPTRVARWQMPCHWP